MFIGMLLLLIPFQATFLDSMSLFGMRPDLCLITACLIGFWVGHTQGFALGFFLGFAQDLFSPGELWLNALTKAGVGYLSGLSAKHLANINPRSAFIQIMIFSLLSGVIFSLSSRVDMDINEVLKSFPRVILPQAVFDGIIGLGANWVIARWSA